MGIGLIIVGVFVGDLLNINIENIKFLLDLFIENFYVGMINVFFIFFIIIGVFILLVVVLSIVGVFC